MADEAAAVADSAPVAEAATTDNGGTAATQPDVTHGDEASETTAEPVQAADPAEPEADDDDDGDEPDSEHQTEEEKTKAQRRRERRQQREQARINEAVQAELKRERETAAQQAAAEQQQKQAEQRQSQWRERFGSFVGSPETRTALSKEIDDLIQTTISAKLDGITDQAEYDRQFDRLTTAQQALAEKRAELARLDTNSSIYDELDKFQFENTKASFEARASGIPEAHRRAYLSAQTVDQALERLEAGIRADEQAKAKAAADKLEGDWRDRYEKEVAAHAATRTGGAGNGPSPNGANGVGSGAGLTRESFLALPKEQKDRMRREQPGLVAEIYSRSA